MGAISAQQEVDRKNAIQTLKASDTFLFPFPSLFQSYAIDEGQEKGLLAAWPGNPMQKILAYEIQKRIHLETMNLSKSTTEDFPSAKKKIEGLQVALSLILNLK